MLIPAQGLSGLKFKSAQCVTVLSTLLYEEDTEDQFGDSRRCQPLQGHVVFVSSSVSSGSPFPCRIHSSSFPCLCKLRRWWFHRDWPVALRRQGVSRTLYTQGVPAGETSPRLRASRQRFPLLPLTPAGFLTQISAGAVVRSSAAHCSLCSFLPASKCAGSGNWCSAAI